MSSWYTESPDFVSNDEDTIPTTRPFFTQIWTDDRGMNDLDSSLNLSYYLNPDHAYFESTGGDQLISGIAQPASSEVDTASVLASGHAAFLSPITGWSNGPLYSDEQGIGPLPHPYTSTMPQGCIDGANTQFGVSAGGDSFSFDTSLLPPGIHNIPSDAAYHYLGDHMGGNYTFQNLTPAGTYTVPEGVMYSTEIFFQPPSQSSSVREQEGDWGARRSLRTLLPKPTEQHLLEPNDASRKKPWRCSRCPLRYKDNKGLRKHCKNHHGFSPKPREPGRRSNSSRPL